MFPVDQLARLQVHFMRRSACCMVTRQPVTTLRISRSFSIQSRRNGAQWTEEDIERVVQLGDSGAHFEEIAESFPGRSVNALRKKYYQHSSAFERPCRVVWTKEESDRVVHLRKSGVPWEEIAALTPGRTIGAVKKIYWKNEHSVQKPARPWTADENALVAKMRKDGVSWDKIASNFPERTIHAVQTHYYNYVEGAEMKIKEVWTVEEYERLHRMKKSGASWADIAAAFPNRTKESLMTRYGKGFPIRNRAWFTKEEDALLRESRNRGDSWAQTSKLFPNRSVHLLRVRWHRYTFDGKVDRRRTPPWTEKEDARLLELRTSKRAKWTDISEKIPGRSPHACLVRFQRIGPRTETGAVWRPLQGALSPEQRAEMFKLHSEGMTPKQIHAKLRPDLKFSTIKSALSSGRLGRELGKDDRTNERWSRKEEKDLFRMRQIEHMPFKEIATILNRASSNIAHKYYRLTEGTVRTPIRSTRAYTPEETATIYRLLKEEVPVKDIAAEIGRTSASLYNHLKDHREEFGYLNGPVKDWHERKAIIRTVVEYKEREGMTWDEIAAHLPDYSRNQLKSIYQFNKRNPLHSNHKSDRHELTEEQLQDLAAKVRKMRQVQHLTWQETKARFPQYSMNRLKTLYRDANAGGPPLTPSDEPRKTRASRGRSAKDIDMDKLIKYREEGLSWRDIQPLMSDWSLSTLQRAWTLHREESQIVPEAEISKAELRKIARLKNMGMRWLEIQAHMNTFSTSKLQRVYNKARMEGRV